jgi:hypothetical protein
MDCINCEKSKNEYCKPIKSEICETYYCKYNLGAKVKIDNKNIIFTKFGVHGK